MPGRRIHLFALCAMVALLGGRAACAQAIHPGDRYVALGSSYAAGPGIGTKDSAGGDCARSSSNYAHQLAVRRDLQLTDASCSGATTDDILTVSQTSNGKAINAPQIDAVTSDTALVTVTIGGNDVDYIGNLLGKSCMADNKNGSDARRTCHASSPATVAGKFATLAGKLDAVIAAIRQRAPHARIVLVDYLPVLPNADGCAGVPLSHADAAAIFATYQKLATIERERAAANGAGFVASGRLAAGHDACSADPYTTNYHPPVSPGWQHGAAYHPTLAGMTAIADALDKMLDAK